MQIDFQVTDKGAERDAFKSTSDSTQQSQSAIDGTPGPYFLVPFPKIIGLKEPEW